MRLRIVQLAILALTLAAVCGCSRVDEHVLTLRDWTFVGPDDVRVPLQLPARVDASMPHSDSELRLLAHVDLPGELRGRRLTLAFTFLHARATLLANGEEMVGLSPRMHEGFRGTDQARWRIPAEISRAGAIDLELDIPYRHVMSAWLDTAPRLSDTEDGDAAFRAIAWVDEAQAVACLATVLIMSLLYGIVFALDRRRAAHGWLALQGTFGGAGYAIAYVGVLSQTLFGAYENAVIPVFLCIGVVASVEFTHAQFGLGRPSRVWWWALAGCVVVAALVPSPFVGPRVTPKYSCVMMVANVAYQIPIAWRVWRQRQSLAALVIFLSWLALGGLGAPDLVAWGGLGEIASGLRGGCLGLAFVALMQAIVLSVEHEGTLARTDALNAQLSAQLDAVSRLNEELRRQIAARADALALALAQASAPRSGGQRILSPGEIVAKTYRVERAVGEGATGKVYEVTRLSDGVRLALKLLDPNADATEMARFAREAQIIAQLNHPNVVRIADIDVTQGGFMYLVVEFVQGLSLRHHYAQTRTLKWNVEVLAQVAEGLEAIHARGIVHRDLKPGNVLVTASPHDQETPRAKLADFGISSGGVVTTDRPPPPSQAPPSQSAEMLAGVRAPAQGSSLGSKDDLTITGPSSPESRTTPSISVGSVSITGGDSITRSLTGVTATDSLLTQTGAWMGTPKYMAPELAADAKHARPAADVFAFGVMAFEMLSGKGPFEEPPAITRAKGAPFVSAPPLRGSAGEIDERIARLLERCLAEEARERPDARELAATLRGYVGRISGSMRPAAVRG